MIGAAAITVNHTVHTSCRRCAMGDSMVTGVYGGALLAGADIAFELHV
jgi:hypothetical protein